MNKVLNQQTLHILRKAIGNESYLFQSKIMFSSLIYLKNGNLEDSYIIKKTTNTPKFLEDWIIYLTMRSTARSFLTTGKMIRDEKDVDTYSNLDFYGYDDLERLFFAQTQETDEKKAKNVFILSKSTTLDDIFQLNFFKEDFAIKYVMLNEKDRSLALEDESAKKYFDAYNIRIIKEDKIACVNDAFMYMKKNIEFSSPILFEIGPTTLMEYMDELKPEQDEEGFIDFVLVSAYTGYLSEDCIGPRFPSVDKLTSGMKLVNVSQEIPSENGMLKFYTFIRERKGVEI